ncbi:MAG TPA: cytochrome c [Bryobacteraceae bacterium]|nr:cytochrome c [Bryobacteraceae bacterium]
MRDAVCVGTLSALLTLPCLAVAADSGTPQVTFARDIAPIFQEKCQECHRKGTAAPMSLVSYEETRPWAKSIKQRVITRNMPPWHLDKTVGIQHFQNDRSLTDPQIATIVRWVDAGAPEGDSKEMPPPKQWPSDQGWQLAKLYGEPDLVLKSESYTMPAHGQDTWFKPYTEVPITEPRWVRAVEIRPSTAAGRKIMHHVLAYLYQEEPGTTPAAGAGGMANAGLLMEWAIGKSFDIYRPNTGKLLLPGSHISWELHLHAVGEQIRDQAELAVYFYPKGETPKYRTRLTLFNAYPNTGSALDIPPNTVAESQGYHVLPQAARLENFQPHMHLRGKAMALEAILPDGSRQMLSYVNNFNFNWMNNYIYADDDAPVLPKGTIIHVTAWHDNTRANPHNPDPDQWVGFGDRTVDEMAHAWVNVTYMSDADYTDWLSHHKTKPAATGLAAARQ